MIVPEHVTVAAGLAVGAGVPIAGILFYWMLKSMYSSKTERPEQFPSAHGPDRRV